MSTDFFYTQYFEIAVLPKRPYLQLAWCIGVVLHPLKTEQQPDGRVRFWGYVPELDRVLRVVTLADRRTIHNAFPDRGFSR